MIFSSLKAILEDPALPFKLQEALFKERLKDLLKCGSGKLPQNDIKISLCYTNEV